MNILLASVIHHHCQTLKNRTYRPYFLAMFPETTIFRRKPDHKPRRPGSKARQHLNSKAGVRRSTKLANFIDRLTSA